MTVVGPRRTSRSSVVPDKPRELVHLAEQYKADRLRCLGGETVELSCTNLVIRSWSGLYQKIKKNIRLEDKCNFLPASLICVAEVFYIFKKVRLCL